MEAVLIKLLNMSITAGWLVLAVVLLRVLLKKAPKWLHCMLWGLVGIRLICPFAVETVFSLIPSAETIPGDITVSNAPSIDSGIPAVDRVINPILSENTTPLVSGGENPMEQLVQIAALIWVAGMIGMALYSALSYWKLYRRVRVSLPHSGNIYLCDEIDSPFILGITRPRIYLPSAISEQQIECVVAHEQAHLKRRDHWWKPIGFALLTVYWFNPLLWVAYVLLCRDIEMACDERVIRDMGAEEKKTYSEALLACSISGRGIMACPLAFGEVGVKERIKSVLSYKKPVLWVIVAAVAVSLVAAVCLLTDPASGKGKTPSKSEPGSESTGHRESFEAEVIEIISESRISVKADGDGFEAQQGELTVTTKLMDGGTAPNMKVGDRINIVYNGMIAASDPGQVLYVYEIEVLETEGDK